MAAVPTLSPPSVREEWPDAEFELNDDEPLHTLAQESDRDDDEDWDVEMDLGKTGGAKAQAVVAGITARLSPFKPPPPKSPMVTIRPPLSLSVDEDDEEEEGFSTITLATLRPVAPGDSAAATPKPPTVFKPAPVATISTPFPIVEDDFESAFSLPSELKQLSLRPLSHQSSKNSLEWGDKDQTSSSQSSDAYSTLGLDHASISSNSTQAETETEDDDEEDLDGLVIPSNIFESGSGGKHLAHILELKKTAPLNDGAVKITRPNPEDDFEIGLVIGDDVDFSPSRLRQTQQLTRRPLSSRSKSLPTRPPSTTRPPSRIRTNRAKSPINPPQASQRQLQKISGLSSSPPPRIAPVRSQSALLAPTTSSAKAGSLRGQKSHTGLNPSSPPSSSQRKLTRKASLSSLMEPVASGSSSASAGPSQGPSYNAPTAASRAKTHSTSTGRMRGLEYNVPPAHPTTPSSNPAALRLTMPTNSSRLKSRPSISSVFPNEARASSPALARAPSSLSMRSRSGSIQRQAGSGSGSAPTGPKLLRKPKRIRAYGDGTELDDFEDLPTDRDKESQYHVQPKGYGNRVSSPKAAYPDLGKGTIRRKSKRDVSSVGSGSESAPRTLKRTGRIDSSKPLPPSEASPKRKKVGSPSHTRRKPTLIRNLGSSNAPKIVGDMKWNPQTLRWEGNDQALRDFDAAMGPTRPALITHLTGSSVGSPVNSFASGARRVGNMIFDPQRMCWISTLAPEDDEPDVFADLADDEGDWDARGGTLRPTQATSAAPSEFSGGDPPSPARSRVRSPSDSGSDRGSRASMVYDVDETFLDDCRAAEERNRSEMKGWRGKLTESFGIDRSYLHEIRALATRKY